MYKTLFKILTTFLFVLSLHACGDTAKITVKVESEDGKPIEGATVRLGFWVGGEEKESEREGVTDTSGSYTASSLAIRTVGGSVIKDGYYMSLFDYNFHKKNNGRWEPWNPTVVVVLREKVNPTPMYARSTYQSRLEIPVIGEEVGLDLTKFDWVIPHGEGTHSDFIFKIERYYESDEEYDVVLHMSFSNELDGIQAVFDEKNGPQRKGSLFSLPRYAPISGYDKALTKRKYYKLKSKEVGDNFVEGINYFFRIRSVKEDGKIKKAMYGKLLSEIKVEPRTSDTAAIFFKYYLNPDYSRNLEFDPEQNLFRGLPVREQVAIR